MNVRTWLKDLGLAQHAELFEQNDIDAEVLSALTEADLQSLGLSLGHRKKLLKAIAALDPLDAVAAPPPSEAERRQITVMFCDLVGSTALSEQLDPGDLRDLMAAYQSVCGGVIEGYDGHVAQYLGDGLMTYFGWPVAHEDSAERAVSAALDIVGAVKDVAAPAPLQVRVGIATGPVVVGETGAGDASIPKLAVGETPNIAARIQGLAGPDQIAIAPTTRRILGGTFEVRELGKHALKGIVEPVSVARVVGVSAAEGRFAAAHTGQIGALVGRDAEMAMLADRWQRALDGEGQVITLCGEPGIGKSRLVQAIRGTTSAPSRITCWPSNARPITPIPRSIRSPTSSPASPDSPPPTRRIKSSIGSKPISNRSACRWWKPRPCSPPPCRSPPPTATRRSI